MNNTELDVEQHIIFKTNHLKSKTILCMRKRDLMTKWVFIGLFTDNALKSLN